MSKKKQIPVEKYFKVSLLKEQARIQRPDLNSVALMATDMSVLSTDTPFKSYSSMSGIEGDFGSQSLVASKARAIFSQARNPATVSGGNVAVAFWRQNEEPVGATNGITAGVALDEKAVMPVLQSITDGCLTVIVDSGTAQTFDNLSFADADNLTDVAAILNAKFSGCAFAFLESKIVAVSDTNGALSSVEVIEGLTNTPIGAILKITIEAGAVQTDGEAAYTNGAESPVDALIRAYDNGARAFAFANMLTADQNLAIAEWAQSKDVLVYLLMVGSAKLTKATSEAWEIKRRGYTHARMIYALNNCNDHIAYMAIAHSVDFAGINTALTMQYKDLIGSLPNEIDESTLDKILEMGMDVYADFAGTPKMLTSGANAYTDSVYIDLSIKVRAQYSMANTVATIATKIAQTEEGMSLIRANIARDVLIPAVNSGMLSRGKWLRDDYLGQDKEAFLRAIEQVGYFVYSIPVAEQLKEDRLSRKASRISIGCKKAGAIHEASAVIALDE